MCLVGENLASELVEMGIEDEAEEGGEEDEEIEESTIPDNSIFTTDKHNGLILNK